MSKTDPRTKLIGAVLSLVLVSWSGFCQADEESGDAKSEVSGKVQELHPTHKQARVIRPMFEGRPIALNTFCLDHSGNILACVGGSSVQYTVNEDGSQQVRTIEQPRQLQLYSPEGALVRSVDLPFKPTAVNVAANGIVFVGGEGKIARIDSEGHVLATADSPHVGSIEDFKQRIEAAAKKQVEENTARYREQAARIEERIKALQETPEADRTEVDARRLTTYEKQKELYETQISAIKESSSGSSSSSLAITRKLGITALAVTSKDVFLCAYAVEGSGFEVWRMTHEFSEPTKVVERLGGCCGQCDIQATETHLVLAENTRFKVAFLDRDGERLMDFGKGDRKAVDGFGSCCNPMNVRCCDNGDILTAESSIGTIKRFSKTGELIGVVGKAKIGGGCKHVAVAFDEKRDRYYMMNVDKDHICVLVPNAEAPEITPEEALARQAREGLGQKLVGAWSLDGKMPADENAAPQVSVKISETKTTPKLINASRVRLSSDPYSSSFLNFEADGNLISRGDRSTGVDQGWECIRQDGNTLYVSKIQGNIQYYEYKIEFVTDDEATISLIYNERMLSSNRYQRVLGDPAKAAENTEKTE
ncbi:MAG: hypothetical protein U0936_09810 [Planctomycetaceae bacterium]